MGWLPRVNGLAGSGKRGVLAGSGLPGGNPDALFGEVLAGDLVVLPREGVHGREAPEAGGEDRPYRERVRVTGRDVPPAVGPLRECFAGGVWKGASTDSL